MQIIIRYKIKNILLIIFLYLIKFDVSCDCNFRYCRFYPCHVL